MGMKDIFESFSADFEAAVRDDDWSRLGKHLAGDATYLNVDGPDTVSEGREAIIAYLQNDVARFDRRFDKRSLMALTAPKVEGDRLTRRWRCTYSLDGAPDLIVEGEARYRFEGNLIKAIEQELSPASMQTLDEWMRLHSDRLAATLTDRRR